MSEMKKLLAAGTLPAGTDPNPEEHSPHLMGAVAAVINDIKPAREIVEEMVAGAVVALNASSQFVSARL